MAHRSLGHRAPLLWLVLPYAAGLAFAKSVGLHGFPPAACLAGAAIAAIAAILVARRSFAGWATGIVIAMGLAGAASYTLNRARLPAWNTLPPREAELELRIDRNFAAHGDNRATGLATVTAAAAHLQDLIGQRIYYSLRLPSGDAPPLPSSIIKALGLLELLPETSTENSFAGYLANAGMNFRLGRGTILATAQPPSAYQRFCARTADRFAAILSLGVGSKRPELAGILRAMLLGRKGDLSEDQGTLFMQSGTMHLFAISGLHIGAIAMGIYALLTLARFPRLLKFVVGLAAVGLYVNITGNAPSAVRAFTMVVMLQASFLFRLPGNPLSALAASALIVLCHDPLQWFSASFQLSYGIVAALLLLGLPLADTLAQRWPLFTSLPSVSWRWWHQGIDLGWRVSLGALAIGIASVLFSTIAGIQYFGLFTPGALVANLVLIPVATFVILGGMISLLCGLAGFTAGSILCNHAAVFTLWGIDEAIRGFVGWPGVHHAAAFRAAWIGPSALALLLASLLTGYAAKWTRRAGSWWPPFALVALTLIFGVNFL